MLSSWLPTTYEISNLPERTGSWGKVAFDNCEFINAIFWILRTSAQWRDSPPNYGDWKNTHRRFCRWRDNGIWEGLLGILIDDPDFKCLMSSTCCGGSGEEIRWWVVQNGLNTKIHITVDAHCVSIRMFITEKTTADCTQVFRLEPSSRSSLWFRWKPCLLLRK